MDFAETEEHLALRAAVAEIANDYGPRYYAAPGYAYYGGGPYYYRHPYYRHSW